MHWSLPPRLRFPGSRPDAGQERHVLAARRSCDVRKDDGGKDQDMKALIRLVVVLVGAGTPVGIRSVPAGLRRHQVRGRTVASGRERSVKRLVHVGVRGLVVAFMGVASVVFVGTPANAAPASCTGNQTIFVERIKPGSTICPGDVAFSASGKYGLVQQWDGNLVLYLLHEPFHEWTADGVVWATGRRGAGNYAYLDHDGHLEIYSSSGFRLSNPFSWESHPRAWVKVQNDGKLVMYTTANVPLYEICKGYKWCRV